MQRTHLTYPPRTHPSWDYVQLCGGWGGPRSGRVPFLFPVSLLLLLCFCSGYMFPFWPVKWVGSSGGGFREKTLRLVLGLNPEQRVSLTDPWAEGGLTWELLGFYRPCPGVGASLCHFRGSSRRLGNLIRIGLRVEPLTLFCGLTVCEFSSTFYLRILKGSG